MAGEVLAMTQRSQCMTWTTLNLRVVLVAFTQSINAQA